MEKPPKVIKRKAKSAMKKAVDLTYNEAKRKLLNTYECLSGSK
ncbi:MAG TPA: hypothetical protein VMW20_03155 [Candidatus Nanoarchaeia archaeon]|nr:hypothetical protein [Candidatus Nanoarchaeia archaeon]